MVKSATELLRLLRRPTLTLKRAQAHYDPMIHAVAGALTAEFGVEWSVGAQAELDSTGKRWEYTTQTLTSTKRLDAFADWSSRYSSAVQSVAQVTLLGTQGYDPDPASDPSPFERAESHRFATANVDIELVVIDPFDLGPSRVTRDAVGGDIELDIDSEGTTISIVAVVAGARL